MIASSDPLRLLSFYFFRLSWIDEWESVYIIVKLTAKSTIVVASPVVFAKQYSVVDSCSLHPVPPVPPQPADLRLGGRGAVS